MLLQVKHMCKNSC